MGRETRRAPADRVAVGRDGRPRLVPVGPVVPLLAEGGRGRRRTAEVRLAGVAARERPGLRRSPEAPLRAPDGICLLYTSRCV